MSVGAAAYPKDATSLEELFAKADRALYIAKEKGKVRSEGKDYVVQDGDVVLFRFNV